MLSFWAQSTDLFSFFFFYHFRSSQRKSNDKRLFETVLFESPSHFGFATDPYTFYGIHCIMNALKGQREIRKKARKIFSHFIMFENIYVYTVFFLLWLYTDGMGFVDSSSSSFSNGLILKCIRLCMCYFFFHYPFVGHGMIFFLAIDDFIGYR